MKLTTFEWNNGTIDKPIVLSAEQIQTLCDIKESVETANVSGYITAEESIPDYLKAVVEDTYPNLKYIGETTITLPNVYIDSIVMLEGSSLEIKNRYNSIPVKYLDFEIISHNITREDSSITETTIKNRIKVENGYVICDAPNDNASWSDEIKIKATPKFNKTGSSTLTITIQAIGVDSITIDNDSNLQHNSTVIFETSIVPVTTSFTSGIGNISTKSSILRYKYNVTYDTIPSTYSVFINSDGVAKLPKLSEDNKIFKFSLRVDVYILNNTTVLTNVIKTFNIGTKFVDGIISSIKYVQSNMLSASIVGSIATSSKDFNSENNVFCWIKENSEFVFGKYNEATGTFDYRNLYKHDRRYYANDDGTKGESAIDDITNNNNNNNNGFVKLPEFWYKFDKTVNKTYTTVVPDTTLYLKDYGQVYDVTFVVTNSLANTVKEGENPEDWIHWDGKTLIGIWAGSIDIYGNTRSLSGKTPFAYSHNITIDSSNSMTPQIKAILIWLFFSWYGKVNTVHCCGTGSDNILRTTGLTDYLGFTDTTPENASIGEGLSLVTDIRPTSNYNTNAAAAVAGSENDPENGRMANVNFWGIENLWGDHAVLLDKIYSQDIMSSYGHHNIYLNPDTIPQNYTIDPEKGEVGLINDGIEVYGYANRATYATASLVIFDKNGLIDKFSQNSNSNSGIGQQFYHMYGGKVFGSIAGGALATMGIANLQDSPGAPVIVKRLCVHYDNFRKVNEL